MSAFSLLSEPIQQALWNMHWTALRPIQEQAIPVVLQTQHDLIISARTAAGKTEAAFLPILSAIHEAPSASIRAIYVGPLKALINDQFRRLEELAEQAQIPVHRWHGDVSANRKQAAAKQPGGVLLITPESLEAMFVNRGSQLAALFHSLSFIVLDELHVMLGTERGLHLRSLLFRLQRCAVNRIRLVALSATLGDLPRSAAWLRPDAPDQVEILTDESAHKSIKYRIHGYLQNAKVSEENDANDAGEEGLDQEHLQATEPSAHDPTTSPTENLTGADAGSGDQQEVVRKKAKAQTPPNIPPEMLRDMYEYFHGQKNLIFANSKSLVELCADGLNRLCEQNGNRQEFLVHHGSLSKETREETETLMQGKLPYTAVCSATLELGIDIGNVSAVGQIGSPHSVNSLAQRLGRSGRKDGEPHCMRLFLKSTATESQSPLQDRLYPDLIQAIALTELMLQKWFEPPEIDQGDLSTFVQQILSVLAETGGIRAVELFDRLVTKGAFRYIDQPTFVAVLRSLGSRDLIEQMPEGDLILGLAGQKIVSHYDFYSAFASAVEFRVTNQARLIGTLPSDHVPSQGDHLLLGGVRWQVQDIDRKRREICVARAHGRKAPLFPPSDRTVHSRVREQMREILGNSKEYPYLSEQATEILSQARKTAQKSGALNGKILSVSDEKSLWFPWTGTKGLRTLEAMASLIGIKAHRTGHPVIALDFPLAPSELIRKFKPFLLEPPTALKLAEQMQPKGWRKYDDYLSEDLLNFGLSRGAVDLENAMQALQVAMS